MWNFRRKLLQVIVNLFTERLLETVCIRATSKRYSRHHRGSLRADILSSREPYGVLSGFLYYCSSLRLWSPTCVCVEEPTISIASSLYTALLPLHPSYQCATMPLPRTRSDGATLTARSPSRHIALCKLALHSRWAWFLKCRALVSTKFLFA